MKRGDTPLATAAKGVAAGLAGTGLMTLCQTAVQRMRKSESSETPARVGKRVIEGVFQRPVPERWTRPLNTVTHLAYGTSWGPLYALVRSSRDGGSMLGTGLAFGAAVWAASLVELPLMKLAPPVWEYGAVEAALDLSYHLVYGAGVAASYAALRA